MNKRHNLIATPVFLIGALLLFLSATGAAVAAKESTAESVTREVRHQLVMLPYYSVFDNLEYKVDGSTVTLLGQVTKPVLKSDAENSVKRIEGVEKVVNNIEVLPLSPNDDRIRRAVYRAIYSFPSLQMYALQAVPSIHIIVKNGHVTLVGVAATKMDKDAAGIRANGVAGVFSVDNQLSVEK
jgi:hyperosmotically inducible protein